MSKTKKVIFYFFSGLIIFILLGWFLFQQTTQGYKQLNQLEFHSPLAEALRVFEYNKSQHSDPVPNCWYDSGDYVIFLPRNVETLFYLSLAHSESKNKLVQADLEAIIYPQLECVEKMLSLNLKQFRDQANHGIQLPPKWNEKLYPNNNYQLGATEGQDIYLMLAQTYTHLKNPTKASLYLAKAQGLGATSSANCCELGPLVIDKTQLTALSALNNKNQAYLPTETWGLKFSALATLQRHNFAAISGALDSTRTLFKTNGEPFQYLGGNYDLAATIALERMYAQESGDQSFKLLSDKLQNYLSGGNDYSYDFTAPPFIYHPCYFFHVCTLSNTLINGIDHKDSTPNNSWQTNEVQLVGQAKYIFSQVLYLNY